MVPETDNLSLTVRSSILTVPKVTVSWNVAIPVTRSLSSFVRPSRTSITVLESGILVLIPILDGRIVKSPKGDSILLSLLDTPSASSVAIRPNFLHLLLQSLSSSPANIHPKNPPGVGLLLNTTSPILLSAFAEGVAIPTVYFLLVASESVPFNVMKLKSFPRSELKLTLLLNTTGPLNSEVSELPEPPSTLRKSFTVTSSNMTLNLSSPPSSPTFLGIGIPMVSS